MSYSKLNEYLTAIKAEKDEKLLPENIKKDVTILGVTGVLESGGIVPTGTINITENGTTNVTSYVSANVEVKYKPRYLNFRNCTMSDLDVELDNTIVDTSNITNIANLFENCVNLVTLPLFDTSNVTQMSSSFYNCSSLTSIALLDTSNTVNMWGMFQKCSSLTTIPLLNTSKVISMVNMFDGCSSLTEFPKIDTSKVENMIRNVL